MASSFRRKRSGALSSLRGTKAWTGGITLTSIGLRDLDAVLGGGQPLGMCLLVEEDRWTRDLALCIVKYWCAEAVCAGQALVIPTSREDSNSTTMQSSLADETNGEGEDESPFLAGCSETEARELIDSLPRNLHWDKADLADSSQAESLSRPLEILEEGEEEGDAEEGLQIAWQYRKSIQQERLGHKGDDRPSAAPSDGVYCHSYNLSGRLKDQKTIDEFVHLVDGQCCPDRTCRQARACGFRLFQIWLRQIKEKLAETKQVVRFLLYHASFESTSVALPLLLSYIRTNQLPVVVLVVAQAWTCANKVTLTSLRRTCDVVLQTEGFASRAHYPPPPEFRHLHGLLLIPKVSTVTAVTANGGGGHFCDFTTTKRPPAHVYGLKRDRRKLHVSLLHIPPEDYAGTGSVSGGAVRSGAGLPRDKKTKEGSAKSSGTPSVGCGSGGGASLLDF